MRNERNILRHELIGLDCQVVASKNKTLIGIRGRIVDETMKTLLIQQDKMKRVAKEGNKFRLLLGQKYAVIDGRMLVARPEDRIKKKFKKW